MVAAAHRSRHGSRTADRACLPGVCLISRMMGRVSISSKLRVCLSVCVYVCVYCRIIHPLAASVYTPGVMR